MYFVSKRGGFVVVVFSLIISLLLSFMTIDIHAFGISSPYIENNTLKVIPGNTYVYTITIQNGDDGDYFVDITHSLEDFVRLDEYSRVVPSKTYNTTFDFIITVPEDAQVGKSYILDYSAKPRVEGEGVITMGVELKRSLTILVTGDESNIPLYSGTLKLIEFFKKENSKNIYKYPLILLTLVLVTIIIVRLWRLSKNISSKIYSEKSNITISQAKNIRELCSILKDMTDEEFELKAIKHLLKNKLSNLGEESSYNHISYLKRKDLLKKLKSKIKK